MLTESAGSFLAHMQCYAKICDIMHRSAEGSTLYTVINKAGRSVSLLIMTMTILFWIALPPGLLLEKVKMARLDPSGNLMTTA